jgi:GNAT superfamily N-acetyltransferase
MAEEKIDLAALEIVPLYKGLLKKSAFTSKDPEYQNLIDWVRTRAIHAHREKKSKTYLAIYKDEQIAFITISNRILIGATEGAKSTTKFQPQVLVIGKLYVCPEYRGSGVGKELLKFALDIARNFDEMTGCLGIIVDSNSNPDTVRFYKNFGFKELVKQDDEDGRTIKMIFNLSTISEVTSE